MAKALKKKSEPVSRAELAALAAILGAGGAAVGFPSLAGWRLARTYYFPSKEFAVVQSRIPREVKTSRLIPLPREKRPGKAVGAQAVLALHMPDSSAILLFAGEKLLLQDQKRVQALRFLLKRIRQGSREISLKGQPEELNNIRLYLKIIHEGFWDWDIRRGKVNYSPQLLEMMGYQPSDWTDSDKEWESRIHPEDKPMVLAALEDHFQKKAPFDLEYRLRVKAGEYRWFRDWGTAFFDAEGKPLRMVGAQVEITQTKLKELEFRERVSLSQLNADITTLLSKPEPLKKLLQQCLDRVQEALGAALGRIWFANAEGDLEFAAGTASLIDHDVSVYKNIPRGRHLAGAIALTKASLETNDLLSDPRFEAREWAIRHNVRSFVGIPLMDGNIFLGVFAQFSQRELSSTVTCALYTVAEVFPQAISRRHFEDERTRFSTLADHSEQFIAIADRAGNILSINRAGRLLTGISPWIPQASLCAISFVNTGVLNFFPGWRAARRSLAPGKGNPPCATRGRGRKFPSGSAFSTCATAFPGFRTALASLPRTSAREKNSRRISDNRAISSTIWWKTHQSPFP